MSNIRTGLPPQSQTWAINQNQRLASAEDNIRILTESIKGLQKRLQLQEQLMSQVSLDRQNTVTFSESFSGKILMNYNASSVEEYIYTSIPVPEGFRSASVSMVGAISGVNNIADAIKATVFADPFYAIFPTVADAELGVGNVAEIAFGIGGEEPGIPYQDSFTVVPLADDTIDVSQGGVLFVGYWSACLAASAIPNAITGVLCNIQLSVAFKREEL